MPEVIWGYETYQPSTPEEEARSKAELQALKEQGEAALRLWGIPPGTKVICGDGLEWFVSRVYDVETKTIIIRHPDRFSKGLGGTLSVNDVTRVA